MSTPEMSDNRKNRKVFNKSNEQQKTLSRDEEIYNAIANVFSFRCSSLLSFENIFKEIKNNSNAAWHYINGDRRVLRWFIEFYNENFEFIDGSYTLVTNYPNRRFSAKYNYREFEIKQNQKEVLVQMRQEKLYSKYDVVFEYDALNCILAIFFQSGREKLQYDFIEDVLQRK